MCERPRVAFRTRLVSDYFLTGEFGVAAFTLGFVLSAGTGFVITFCFAVLPFAVFVVAAFVGGEIFFTTAAFTATAGLTLFFTTTASAGLTLFFTAMTIDSGMGPRIAALGASLTGM